jgi:GT2 family glycosyltransferase
MSVKYSLIIPTFKRADEVQECLESLTKQTFKNFEVILADGTPGKSLEEVAVPFKQSLNLQFLYEEFIGVSEARNMGYEHANGEYIIFLDSDCIIPKQYMQTVDDFLQKTPLDLFGGPDAADASFTPLQKAISYSMTSVLTTGGIRGKKTHMGKFHPRSFNMGMRKEVFKAVNGYSDLKCGEDVDLSIRIIKAGFKTGLIEDAFVYHKRRTNLKQFFKQVYRFGAARINIFMRHREELKITHLFPLAFSLGLIISILLLVVFPMLGKITIALYIIYLLVAFLHSSIENKDLKIGALSIITILTQFFGYGWGMFKNGFAVFVLGKKEGIDL